MKKSKKTKNTAPATTSGGSSVRDKVPSEASRYTFEIRKFVKAANIVEAFNLDITTPPTYIVATNEDEASEETNAIGFNER